MPVTALVICAADEHGDFEDPEIPRRRFAAADARAAAALAGSSTVLVGEEATRDRVRKAVKRAAAQLTADDTLLLYYVGHGGPGLVCHDSPAAADLEGRKALPGPKGKAGTAGDDGLLPVEDLVGPLVGAAGTSLVLVDAGAQREDGAGVDRAALEAACKTSKAAAWMVSASPGELSHESLLQKRGVWSLHVLEQLGKGGVTAADVAKAVAEAVPRTLRTESSTVKLQTPAAGGPLKKVTLGGAASAGGGAAGGPDRGVVGLTLTAAKRVRVKELSGFKKGWTVPDQKNDYWDSKAANWAEAEIEADLADVFARLKDAFKFKRRDLDKRGPDGGYGTLVTPGFDYNAWAELDADEPSKMVLRREVTKISDPALVLSDAFERVFSTTFDAVRVAAAEMIDVEGVIDRIEDREDDSVSLDYDADCTYCHVAFAGRTASARVTADGLAINDPEAGGVQGLLKAAAEVRANLHDALAG